MEISLFFQTLIRGWWIILLTVLFALAASLGASYMIAPQFEAISRFILSPSSLSAYPAEELNPNTLLQSIDTINNQMVVNTYAEVMRSNLTYVNALELLQLQTDDLMDYSYAVVVLPNSSVLELSVEGPDPEITAKLANSIGYETIAYTRGLNQLFNLDFLDTALPPTEPIRPQPLRDAFLAGVFGLIGGGILAVLNDQLRFSWDRFRQNLRVDASTGVYHRKFFPEVIENELAENPDSVLTIGILELSGISDIFDTFPAGGLQRIFQRVAEILRKELRGNDVIGLWDDISFIVMLPNTTGLAATRIFERISEALCEPMDLGQYGTMPDLNSFIGGAESYYDTTAQELFEKASESVNQARHSSGNPVHIWKK
ncbi:MAG: diguanylate cyclase [Anaerolineales bacterium]|jgi:diguanylate cyclase (GGDEF)-like protein